MTAEESTYPIPAPIVVGVDGSEENLGALRWSVDEALRTNTTVKLLLVIDHRVPERREHLPNRWDVDAEADKVLEVARDLTSSLHRDVHVETQHVTGSPAAVLAKAGEEAGMLVLGRRGRGTFARLTLGSVSDATARRAATATVVVPGRWDPSAHRTSPVVVAVDEGPGHEDALRFAFERAERRGIPLRAVHVADVSETYDWDTSGKMMTEEAWKHAAKQVLDVHLAAYRDKFPDVEVVDVPRQGHPVEAIVEEAADAELVVLGGHPQKRLAGALLGSVSTGVLHHVTCPVAVVHERHRTQT